MKMIEHPSTYISPELVWALRSVAGETELLKQLHPKQLAIIHEQKWFQLFVPEQFGGLGLNLPDALQEEEGLAWTDGSIGWTVTLCAGAGWFIGFLNAEIVPEFFDNPTTCLAGSGKASGIAKVIADGYEITGSWDYATGANSATAFTANCLIEEDSVLLKNVDGSLVIRSFIFHANEVTILETWKQIGMIATGSHSFEVKGLKVKGNRAFLIDSQLAVLKNPVYQYPFKQLAETTLAVNSSGMAIRFLDLCEEQFQQEAYQQMYPTLQKAVSELDSVRKDFYRIMQNSWEECVANHFISTQLLLEVSSISKQLAFTSRQLIDELYPYCGMKAANPETEMNRVWRNIHTASQHSMFNR